MGICVRHGHVGGVQDLAARTCASTWRAAKTRSTGALSWILRGRRTTTRTEFTLLSCAKDYFRTGYVLPHIDHRAGAVDHTRTMSIGNFVAFLRAALVNIGLTRRKRPYSQCRARGLAAPLRPQPKGCTRRAFKPGGRLLRGMALLAQSPIPRGAASRLARHRPLSL
jgi:hypothetical protein